MPPPLLGCLRRCFELDNALRPVMAELLKGCNESASWLNAELPLVSKSAKASSSREDLVDSLYTVARVLLATKGRRDAAIDALKDVLGREPNNETSNLARTMSIFPRKNLVDKITGLDFLTQMYGKCFYSE